MQISDERLEILDQGFIAFGAGCQGYRVSRDACRVLHGFFLSFVSQGAEAENRLKNWDDPHHSSEMLDMVFVLGRLASQIACEEGQVAIHDQHVRAAVDRVRVAAHPQQNNAASGCDGNLG